MSKQEFVPDLSDLLPGGLSGGGFLKRGQTLNGVISRDKDALDLLGYSYQEIVDLIRPVCNLNYSGDYTAPNGRTFAAQIRQYRGWQNCPWRDDGDKINSSKDIFLKTEGRSTLIPGLIWHLIAAHHFFEGGEYRVSPEQIVEMLGTERIPGSLKIAKALPLG